MKFTNLATALSVMLVGVSALDKPLDIEYTKTSECTVKTKPGDKVEMVSRRQEEPVLQCSS